MKSSKTKRIMLIVSILWLLLAIIPMILEFSNLKFPVVDFSDIFFLVLFLAMPVAAIVLSLLPERLLKKAVYIGIGVAFALYFCYICVSTLGFSSYRTGFYPVTVSETDDFENYLVLDEFPDSGESNVIHRVFPQSIPADAKEVDYHYRSEPYKGAWEVYATWKLSDESYQSELNRIKAMSSGKYESDGVVYYNLSNAENRESYCHVGFDDEANQVEYVDVLWYSQSSYMKIMTMTDCLQV